MIESTFSNFEFSNLLTLGAGSPVGHVTDKPWWGSWLFSNVTFMLILSGVVTAWLILFGSKFVMLGAINYAFGDRVLFTGPLHGVVAFILVVVVMLVAEELAVRFYHSMKRTQGD